MARKPPKPIWNDTGKIFIKKLAGAVGVMATLVDLMIASLHVLPAPRVAGLASVAKQKGVRIMSDEEREAMEDMYALRQEPRPQAGSAYTMNQE